MTSIVVDANFSLALVLPLPFSPQVVRRMATWQDEMPHLMAPSLWEYEVVSSLQRACFLKLLTRAEAQSSLEALLGLALEVVPASDKQHARALEWAERLGQAKAYDTQYLALAELASAEFWTADRRLANSAAGLGVGWVHWVGEG